MDNSISSRSPPNEGHQGIFGRLLRRAKSTKGTARSRRRPAGQPDNLPDSSPTDEAEGATSNLDFPISRFVEQLPRQQQLHHRPQTSAAATPHAARSIAQQPQHTTATLTATTSAEPQLHQQRLPRRQATSPDISGQMAQPTLKKKASFRDRLRSWQKPTQGTAATPATKIAPASNEQPKPRFVYQPKHAAADFSRMVISPTAPTPRRAAKESFDEDRTLSPSLEHVDIRNTIPLPEDDAELVLKTRRLSPPLQTLVENEAVSEGRSRRRQGKQRDDSTRKDLEDSKLRHSRSGLRRPYNMVEDPWKASQAAAHVPIGSIPVRSLSAANRRAKSHQVIQVDDLNTPLLEQIPPLHSTAGPISDFEAFLARAEAEDRAKREQILRSFSHHSAAQSTNYVKPNPHRQYATIGGGELSGTTITGGRTSAAGSRSSRGGSQRTSGQFYALAGSEDQQPQARSGHKKHASWTPSFGNEGADIERALEKNSSAYGSAQQPPVPRSRRSQQPVVYGVDENYNQPEQHRTLRRQASITQRIAGYIKPTRDLAVAGDTEQTLYHSESRSGLRRSTSQRQHRAIGTLAE